MGNSKNEKEMNELKLGDITIAHINSFFSPYTLQDLEKVNGHGFRRIKLEEVIKNLDKHAFRRDAIKSFLKDVRTFKIDTNNEIIIKSRNYAEAKLQVNTDDPYDFDIKQLKINIEVTFFPWDAMTIKTKALLNNEFETEKYIRVVGNIVYPFLSDFHDELKREIFKILRMSHHYKINEEQEQQFRNRFIVTMTSSIDPDDKNRLYNNEYAKQIIGITRGSSLWRDYYGKWSTEYLDNNDMGRLCKEIILIEHESALI